MRISRRLISWLRGKHFFSGIYFRGRIHRFFVESLSSPKIVWKEFPESWSQMRAICGFHYTKISDSYCQWIFKCSQDHCNPFDVFGAIHWDKVCVGHFLLEISWETRNLINQWSIVHATVMLTNSGHSALASGSLEPFNYSFDMAANVCLNSVREHT